LYGLLNLVKRSEWRGRVGGRLDSDCGSWVEWKGAKMGRVFPRKLASA
jgi:hypothetical protein